MRNKLVCVLLFFLTTPLFGQIDEVRRITEALCSPEFHGRGYVYKGDSVAAAFLVNEFKKIGVSSYKKSYTQSFSLNVNTFPGKMSLSQNGKELVAGLDYSVDPASKSFQGVLSPMEISADAIMNFDYIRESITEVQSTSTEANALLFDCTQFSDDTLKMVRSITRQIAEIVPVIELVNKKFTWSVGRVQKFYPFIQIQDSVFEKNVPIELDVEAEYMENYTSQNVVAYIPGKKKCSKTIVFTAHYDHLGRMGADTYFPGANDNASGTAMLFTMARYFQKNRPDFNIMFIAFAGEEAGLVGSKYFVEHPIIKLKKIEFVINLDIMGSGEEGITVVNATLFEKEFELLQQINREKNLLAEIKKRGPAANSDHYWFTQKGVPAFFIYTRGPNKHYHDIFDTYEELSFQEYEDITTLLVTFVNELQNKQQDK